MPQPIEVLVQSMRIYLHICVHHWAAYKNITVAYEYSALLLYNEQK